ncbi:uncharacterized protein HKW66_Vig0131250 [Vigna angularis]|uniref:Uncharacterized protein n=3 Tax=Phaseolus angularis TaxID=3914 RepID=A0A8T0K1Y6_PHAAN|nr:uncharacterized protein HKW66_Vig0131250 [Vigna angularis]BAT81019.1 hypothetical protein VIGAN_03066100 [Vigna angularis var. angularis]
MQRLRSSVFSAPNLKKKYLNSRAAIQDTFFSTKDTFERHRVVFTVGTSIASVATAWFGYTLRHLHDTKVDQRLQSIENAMQNNSNLHHTEIKDIVAGSGGCSIPACIATAGTSLVIGYALGWRGGSWYATKKFRKEQMKMLGQITPRRWQLLGKIKPKGLQFQFLRRNLTKLKLSDSAMKTSESSIKDAATTHVTGKSN